MLVSNAPAITPPAVKNSVRRRYIVVRVRHSRRLNVVASGQRGEGMKQITCIAKRSGLSDEHFNCHPDEINWGHVGTLEHYASLLKRITDSAFSEGEHAE